MTQHMSKEEIIDFIVKSSDEENLPIAIFINGMQTGERLKNDTVTSPVIQKTGT